MNTHVCILSKTFTVLMVYQTPEALNLMNNTLHNKYLQIKLFGQRVIMHDTQLLPMPVTEMNEEETERQERPRSAVFLFDALVLVPHFCFCFLLFKLIFLFVLLTSYFYFISIISFEVSFCGRMLQSLMPDMKGLGKEWNWGA